jgi:hypothetical protein
MTGHAPARRELSPSWTLEEDDGEDGEEDVAEDHRLEACGEARRNVFNVECFDGGRTELDEARRNVFDVECSDGERIELDEARRNVFDVEYSDGRRIELEDGFCKNDAKRNEDRRNSSIFDVAGYDTVWAADGHNSKIVHHAEDDRDDDDDDDDDDAILTFPGKNDKNKVCLSPTSSSSGSLACSLRGSHRLGGGDAPISIACLEHVGGEKGVTGQDDDVMDLDELIRRQQESVSRRRRGSVLAIALSYHRACHRDADGRGPGKKKVWTLEEMWTQYIRTLPKTFFRSNEALMNRAESAIRGKPLFSGLRVDEENSSDMRRVYHLCFESKIRLGQPRGTYDQFRCAVGQYLRTYLSLHTDKVRMAFSPGRLFEAVAEFRLVRAFIGQYQVRASATTVMGKAMHLRRLADEGVSYFTEINEQELKGKCLSVASYLRSVASSYKTEARRAYRSRNTMDDRAERGALLAPGDFQRCLDKAIRALDGVMQHVEQLRTDNLGNVSRFHRMVYDRKGMIDKWNINLLAALVLSGGGQRPQVYAQLELPQVSELQRLSEDFCRDNFTSRCGPDERRPRAVWIYRPFFFHAKYLNSFDFMCR